MPKEKEKKQERRTTRQTSKISDDEYSEEENENEPSKKKRKTGGKRSKKPNKEIPEFLNVRPKKLPQCNILKYYRHYEMGLPCEKYRKPLKDMIIKYCKTFRLYKVESPFNRRVTYIVWHPTNPKLLSVTSHHGDIVLYNYEQDINSAIIIKGIGAGGSVQGMKFDPLNPMQIYTVSMEGKFLVLNFETKEATQFLETNDINRWYISLDVNSSNNLMVAGDTSGKVAVLTLQGEIIETLQVHKKGFKVSHCEFSKREPWLLCTSSTDSTIKLWDIRKMKGELNKPEPLQTIQQIKPVNAAYFSLTDGCRLLTTDQFDKVTIYRAPLWNVETVINHPHRQYQHLTPIKAYWHPWEDIVFIGRYPHVDFPGYHPNELRTLDFFDAETGELLHQHSQGGLNGILSLNRFNVTGDALASSYGSHFLIWKPNVRHIETSFKDFGDNSDKFGGKYGDDDDNDDDDDDGDGDVGQDLIKWEAILKKIAKQKKDSKAKSKKT